MQLSTSNYMRKGEGPLFKLSSIYIVGSHLTFSFKSVKLDLFFFFFLRKQLTETKPAEAFMFFLKVYLDKFQHK